MKLNQVQQSLSFTRNAIETLYYHSLNAFSRAEMAAFEEESDDQSPRVDLELCRLHLSVDRLLEGFDQISFSLGLLPRYLAWNEFVLLPLEAQNRVLDLIQQESDSHNT